MKHFILYILGAATGFGAVYVLMEHGDWLKQNAGWKPQFTRHFLDALEPGDSVVLREGKFGYAVFVLSDEEAAPKEAPAAQEDENEIPDIVIDTDEPVVAAIDDLVRALLKRGASKYEVVEVRRDHVVLRTEQAEKFVPVSQIASIEVGRAKAGE